MDKKFKEFKKARRDKYTPEFAFETHLYWWDNFILKSEKIRDQIVDDMMKSFKREMRRFTISDNNRDMLRFVCCKTIMKMFEGMFFLYDINNDVALELSYDLLQWWMEYDRCEKRVTIILKNWSDFILDSVYKPVIYAWLDKDNIVVKHYNDKVNDSLEMILHWVN